MQISRWGNSLAVRLPADLVRKLGLKEGDDITLEAGRDGYVVQRVQRPEEVLTDLRKFRGRLAPEDRLSRDAAHER